MLQQIRPLILPVGSLLYVGFAAALANEDWGSSAALILLPCLLIWGFRRTQPPSQGDDPIEPVARKALRAVIWGSCLWLMARSGPAGQATLDTAANIGVATAAIATLVSMARISPAGGLLGPPPSTRSLDGAWLVTFLWGIATASTLARVLLPEAAAQIDPLATDYASSTAGVGSLLVLVSAAWRLRVLRRLELGVADRAAGAFTLSLTAFLVAVPASLLDVAPPDRLLPIALLLASLACSWAITTQDSTSVTRRLRGIVAVMVLGTPVVLLTAISVLKLPAYASAIALFGSGLSIVVGLVAKYATAPLNLEQTRWLEAIDLASQHALEPEPNIAIQKALEALSRTTTSPGNRPELWQTDPPETISVDLAGYLHTEQASAPASLYELAAGEPERTLRTETLRSLQVRKPEVRPLLSWLETRSAFCVTLIVDEEGPTGCILLPKGSRSQPLSLEEAKALRNLADRMSALMAIASAISRSRLREQNALAELKQATERELTLARALSASGEANQSFARLLMQPLAGSGYSPASRLTLDRIKYLVARLPNPAPGSPEAPAQSSELAPEPKRTQNTASVHTSADFLSFALLITHPPGVSPLPWSANIHLESKFSQGRLVIIDASLSDYQRLEHWQAEASPLVLAYGGSLVIQASNSLPAEVQLYLASRASQGDTLFIFTRCEYSTRNNNQRVDTHVPPLEALFEHATIKLPSLAERAEELRPLLVERFARAGLKRYAEPLALSGQATRALVEYEWPGNELELDQLVERIADAAAQNPVQISDLVALGLGSSLNERGESSSGQYEVASAYVGASTPQKSAQNPDLGTPLPLPTRRRPTSRKRH